MANGTMPVVKTLVIGIGTKGGDICDYVARRVKWELGSLDRAPWIRFLYLATDENEEVRRLPELRKDFYALRISPEEYHTIVNMPEAFDHIQLRQWADIEVLKQLPSRAVSEGAGNIRMVGRLALLYPRNRDNVVDRLQSRLRELRDLTEIEATEKRGPLPDGTNPSISFGAGNTVRVIVTGTLCGGTCSGTASDFGFLLRQVCPTDRTQAFFTIPHPTFAANKHKKNAYQALVELNSYHILRDTGKFYGVPGSTADYPYDAIFICEPPDGNDESIEKLHQAIADRIFLNSFVPEVDPFGALVDTGLITRDDRAHVFCSFGLASMEYPAQQVIESCSKRLLAYALNEWNLRAIESQQLQARIEEIGLTWEQLRSQLLSSQEGDSVDVRIKSLIREVVNLLPNNMTEAESRLQVFRNAFAGVFKHGMVPQERYPSGFVRHHLMENRESAANHVIYRLREHIQAKLHRYEEGPSRLLFLLHEAQEQMGKLRAVQAPEIGDAVTEVNAQLDRVRRYDRSWKLRIFWLRHAAIRRAKESLEIALQREAQLRLDAETCRVLGDIAKPEGGSDPGVITRLQKKLQPIVKRCDELKSRVSKLAAQLRQEADRLALQKPSVNGICLFEPRVTVDSAYEEMLLARGLPGESVDRCQEREAERVISAWGTPMPGSNRLPIEAIVPEVHTHSTWLDTPVNPLEHGIPAELVEELLSRATEPFLPLTRRDVLEQWASEPDINRRNSLAGDLARAAAPFGYVDEALALKGIRAVRERIGGRTLLLLPNSIHSASFQNAIASKLPGGFSSRTSSQSYRVIILQEQYRWGLHGMPHIAGPGGIAHAQAGDFHVWYTRKDVAWVGITDEEIERLRLARDLVAVSVLLKILQPRNGALQFVDYEHYRLPNDLEQAACSVAYQQSSLDGANLAGFDKVLDAYIRDRWRQAPSDEEFIKMLWATAESGLPGFTKWDKTWFKDRIESYCMRDGNLRVAYDQAFPYNEPLVQALWRERGDPLTATVSCEEPGYYCNTCGALLGYTKEQASQNGWQCPAHDHQHLVRLRRVN